MPANAYNHSGTLASIGCWSAGNCVAVGVYQLAPIGNNVPLAVEESQGTWGTGIEVGAPASSSATVNAQFTAVSCRTGGDCVAEGYFRNTTGNFEAMEATQGSGVTWNAAQYEVAPGNALDNPTATPLGISCKVESCMSVGYYTDTSYNDQAMGSTGAATVFGGWLEMAAPAGAKSTSPGTAMNGVSCATPTSCVAVGGFVNESGNDQAMTAAMAAPTSRPVVAKLTPSSGSVKGGTSVVLRGANLAGAKYVRFGIKSARHFRVVSTTEIVAITPSGTGTVYVSVRTAGGTSPRRAADRFFYRR
jgi:hypothetical protein